jgi:hypothetical protein
MQLFWTAVALPLLGVVAAADMIKPAWDTEMKNAGVDCFDASLAHSPAGGVQNNTRCAHRSPLFDCSGQAASLRLPASVLMISPRACSWTHWAVPEGPPPPTGWPVIVTFEVMGFYPVEGDNATCGDGWRAHYGPPPP